MSRPCQAGLCRVAPGPGGCLLGGDAVSVLSGPLPAPVPSDTSSARGEAVGIQGVLWEVLDLRQ